MDYELFLAQLASTDTKCKLMRTTWFTPQQRLQIKHNFITVPFKRGDRKYLLVVRK